MTIFAIPKKYIMSLENEIKEAKESILVKYQKEFDGNTIEDLLKQIEESKSVTYVISRLTYILDHMNIDEKREYKPKLKTYINSLLLIDAFTESSFSRTVDSNEINLLYVNAKTEIENKWIK